MVAVTTSERVQELRLRFELALTLGGSNQALDMILMELSKLPHSHDREILDNDILDVRVKEASA